ncbi:MAG TPA: putative zinc-binding protein [Victivallales bacterium]|mgnify:CR=1 FL=1|nr:putative zinc-binding protein [Victivallales bacterium]
MENKNQDCCACSSAPKLIFSCSGASDVGAITDQAARKINSTGKGRMFCLAGIGGRVSGIVETTKSAAKIIAIDGCPLNCAKKTLEEAGFANFAQIQLAELGMKKGSSSVNEENINKVVEIGLKLLEC